MKRSVAGRALGLSLLCVAFFCSCGFAQTSNSSAVEPPAVISPSPNVAALGKYGEVQVNLYRGIPDLSIPLTSVKSKDVTVPVSVSYQYTGHKVDEVSSWVGLGFALNAGGVITRVVRGLPDDHTNGYNNVRRTIGMADPFQEPAEFNNVLNTLTDEQKRKLASGEWDGIPDLYYFNVSGKASGKFIFTQQGVRCMPHQSLLITQRDGGWEIIDEKGVKYIFGTDDSKSAIETTTSESTCNGSTDTKISYFTSAWYLLKIQSPSGDEVIFDYESEDITNQEQLTETISISYPSSGNAYCSGLPRKSVCSSISFINAKRLVAITAANSRMEFYAKNYRLDLKQQSGNKSYRLDSIVVFDHNKKRVNKFDFGYEYWGECGINGELYEGCRLLLKSITESGSGGRAKPPYQFYYAYNGLSAPAPLGSYSQDHWGYYNGKGNSTLVPNHERGSLYNRYFEDGANRGSDFQYASAGVIDKIVYPTGGYTLFEYEPNDYGYVQQQANAEEYVTQPASKTASVSNLYETYSVEKTDQKDVKIWFAQEVNLRGTVSTNDYPIALDPAEVQLINVDTGEEVFGYYVGSTGTQNFNEYRTLSPGNYRLRAKVQDKGHSASIEIRFEEPIIEAGVPKTTFNRLTGGIRIKKTVDHDGLTNHNMIKEYSYTASEDRSRSSGVMLFAAKYEYPAIVVIVTQPGDPSKNDEPVEEECLVMNRTARSTAPLGSAEGSHIGYREVTILHGEDGINGSTVYKFTSAYDYNDFVLVGPPFPPPISYEFNRGLTTEITDYDQRGRKVKRVENLYKYNDIINAPNLTGTGLIAVAYEANYLRDRFDRFKYPVLNSLRSQWNYLSQVTTTFFNYSGNGKNTLETVTKYYYNNPSHIQTTSIESEKSDGSKMTTSFTYPLDYQANTATGSMAVSLKAMQDKHVLNSVIEKQIWHEKNASKKLLSGELILYKQLHSSNVVIDSVLSLELNTPLEYLNAAGVKSDGFFSYDRTKYKIKLHYQNYDTQSNLRQYSTVGNIPVSYLWGYNHTYPVAEIKNADYEEVRDALGGQVAVDALAGSAVLSPAQVDQLNNLRKHSDLKDAMITTFTYDPLVGMTSQTGPDGVTLTYEYDDLGRLVRVKDHLGNLVKHYEYHYKQ